MPTEENLNDIAEGLSFDLLAWEHNIGTETTDATHSSVINIKIVNMKLCKKNFDLSSWFLSKRKEFCGITTSEGAKISDVSNCIKLQRIISLQIPCEIK